MVAVGWCGELGATVLPAQAARTRAMREESEAGASKMPGYVGVLVWEWAPSQARA